MAESIALGILLRFKDEASKGVQAALGGISALGKEAEATQKRVHDLEKGFRSLRDTGLGLSAMGAAAGAALVSVIQPAAALQEQVTNALTLTGETGDAFLRMEKGMSEAAVRLSTRLGISADQVAEGFYQVLSTGAQAMTPEFEALSETALKMAKTVGLAPADAVEVLSDSVNQFNLNLTQASRVADVFFTASKLSTLTVPQLVDSMREAGAAASSVGISLEETAAVLSGFAAKGVKGAKAGTAFRMILTRLAKPPEEAARALGFLGVSIFDAQGEMRPLIPILKDMQTGMKGLTGAQKAAVLKAIAGEEAFSKLGGLLDGNLDTIESWRKELEASGALQVAFTQKMSSASEQVHLLWISVKNLATAIGQPLLGPLTGIAGALAGVIQRLEGFAKAHPILGKFAGGALALVSVLGILAGGILTLTGALGLFALKWLPLARTGMGLFSKGLMRAIPLITGWTQAAFSGARAVLAWTAATVKDLAARAAHLASVAAGTIATWAGAAASKAAAAAQWLWNAAMTANPIGLIVVGVAALVAGVALLIANWDAVTGAVMDAFAWMRDLLGKAQDWVLALVFPLGLLIRHFDKVKETAVQVFDTIASAVAGAFEAVRSVIGSVFDWIAEKLAFVTDKVGAVLGFVRDVGGFLGISAAPAEFGGGRAGGQRVVPATASPAGGARAVAQPSPTRAQEGLLPPMALAGAGGSSDQSVTIQSGAIQIHAVRVDEQVIRQIDFELARLIQRRQERR